MLIELPVQFEGKAEVKGYIFNQIQASAKAFLYEVSSLDTNNVHYEVFKRRESKLYDFQNKLTLEDSQVQYPKSNSFGVWAWSPLTLERAINIFNQLN